ncbi:hypothetical protein ACU5EH_20985 [Aliivibrio salmonicida]|uniref:hypothetical protein n=1 Tax=Aliivibrio salmonicida TaxID=40269 RepID=UPI00406C2AB5
MSRYYFSAKVFGVFDSKLKTVYQKNGTWPVDAQFITDEQYDEFFRKPTPNEGMVLGSLNGLPIWVECIKKDSEIIKQEQQWQQSQLTKTSAAIVHYECDAKIPDIYSELRVTTYTEDDYYALLSDRKLLVEYLQQEDFPECGRPTISELANA